MSFIENLITNGTIINVPAQTDTIYKNISSNQCSWCAWEFAVKAKNLISSFNQKNKTEFLNIYNNCLLEGSNKRKNANKLYGENIDSIEILNNYKNFNLEPCTKYTLKKNNENSEFIDILHSDLKEEFYTRSYLMINNFDNFINEIYQGDGYLVSRHGQSFFFVKMSDNKNLILDSHVHEIGIMSDANLKKYINVDENGYLFITFIKIRIF
jgi:hypothetical protein